MKLTIRHCEHMGPEGGGWWVIERAEHDGREWLEKTGPNSSVFMTSARFSDADVEGYGVEMLEIATAIERRGSASFKRCAVRVDGDVVLFRSPLNSEEDGCCSLAEADELAALIRKTIGRQ